MSCNCNCNNTNNNTVAKSNATVAVSSTNLLATPTDTLSPLNEGKVAIRITNSVPANGASLPVTITLNGSAVPVYDKYGNILYGYGIRPYAVMRGYYGNNGASSSAHLQLINYPFYRCNAR